jgi:hypothetical protein
VIDHGRLGELRHVHSIPVVGVFQGWRILPCA